MVEWLMKFQEMQMGKYWVILLTGWMTLAAAGGPGGRIYRDGTR